jgi:hypothetical protein
VLLLAFVLLTVRFFIRPETDRPHRCEAVLLRLSQPLIHHSSGMPRHTNHRELRNVRVLRHEPRHAIQAKPCAEPVDQMRQFLGVIGSCKPGLRRIAPLGDQRREPHHVVAEARIAGVCQNSEPFLE